MKTPDMQKEYQKAMGKLQKQLLSTRKANTRAEDKAAKALARVAAKHARQAAALQRRQSTEVKRFNRELVKTLKPLTQREGQILNRIAVLTQRLH
jgi:hypothetical protein